MKGLLFCLVLAAAVCGTACSRGGDKGVFCPGSGDPAALVDPMIGTRGSGNAVPAATVPHGMARLGPDTDHDPLDPDAYEYDAARIEGFTHTHLQGPGGSGNGYSQVLFMPMVGPLPTVPGDQASAFSHQTEEASAGYYAVTLEDTGIRAELTATAHAGCHRYAFPASDQARVWIDLGHSLGDSRGGAISFTDDRTVEGYGEYMVHLWLDLLLNTGDEITGKSRVYFHARFSRPFEATGTWSKEEDVLQLQEGAREASGAWIGGWASFVTGASDVVEVQVGLSLIDTEQARRNLEAEIGERGFDEVRQAARDAWNCRLGRIEVEGGTASDRTVFVTALYHTLMAPADYTEEGGRFWTAADMRGAVTEWEDRRFYTDDWCAWDTFRTSRPLATLVEPETVDDVVSSYLHLYRQGGWLPKCTWHASGYSRVMIGNHAVAIIADAVTKGFSGFDPDLAWEAVHKSATEDNLMAEGLCGYANLGTPAEYLDLGYVGHECDLHQSASMTLEYAYNDWCTARVAEALGRSEDAATFDARAENYRNQFNPETGFMQGRKRSGAWVEPFDPADGEDANDFCEATSWIYTWFVPHDVPGLIELLGGDEAFVSRLDEFFDGGHFDPSNEPSFHVPWLYGRAGAPEKTRQRVRTILRTAFSDRPDGLPGNDDAGATSAWYVLGAIGLYPLAPGEPVYDLTVPLFERVTIHLHPRYARGKTFVIEAPGAADDDLVIQSATLNGDKLQQLRLRHADILRGGVLHLDLVPTP